VFLKNLVIIYFEINFSIFNSINQLENIYKVNNILVYKNMTKYYDIINQIKSKTVQFYVIQ